MIFGTFDLTQAPAADGLLDVFARCAPLVVVDRGTMEEAAVYESARRLSRRARLVVWGRNALKDPAAYLRAGAVQVIVDSPSASKYLNELPAERVLVALDADRPQAADRRSVRKPLPRFRG
ncbi:MAG TPA: hypothetical protein VGZ02_15135 [Candidatus Baltobacteraceae bacterium]|jgi:hypothetical protein|nr:hypothetical protein [Candidatus Baltobacteraceae bacterium]